uniref:Methyltransferase type 11 domain-containing protein n=1 Tax=Oryza barthii TaxID=65489 RepID=A0A0D3GUH0_9ORYZ
MIGCGSALMSEDMVDDGYTEIMNIDISSVVIEIMRKKHFNIPQLQYMQMDARDMSIFSDESFDCAIDKGTLDSLMCGVGAPLSAAQMVLEVERPGFKGKTKRSVLDPVPMTQSGVLPDGFVPEDPDSHYIYVCKKLQGSTGTSSPTIHHRFAFKEILDKNKRSLWLVAGDLMTCSSHGYKAEITGEGKEEF